MGASFSLSGGQILDALENHLQHLLACEEFIFDLHNHPSKPLTTEHKQLDGWGKEALQRALRFIQKYGAEAELTDAKKLRPVEVLLAELPRLREAKEVVERLGTALRYALPDEDRQTLYKEGKRSLRDRLDRLTEFDDSE